MLLLPEKSLLKSKNGNSDCIWRGTHVQLFVCLWRLGSLGLLPMGLMCFGVFCSWGKDVTGSRMCGLCCRFEEAMSQYTIDHVKRMKHIKATLDATAADEKALQQKEDMLEELLEIVDNIDYARGASHFCLHNLRIFSCMYNVMPHQMTPHNTSPFI